MTGVHVFQYPSGRWGFVGRVPVELCEERAATRGDVLGCRSHRNAARAGEGTGTERDLFAWRVVSHETESAARAFAHARGVELSN